MLIVLRLDSSKLHKGVEQLKIYKHLFLQLLVIILYPTIALIILTNGSKIGSWIVPGVICIIFCFFWRNIKSVLISNLLLCVLTVPIWLTFFERQQVAEVFVASLPFIIPLYLIFVLMPEMFIVILRNKFLTKSV